MKTKPQQLKYQSGQTMVFALVFIVVILIGLIILFNTGQLTRQKMEVQNAADAAAYSSAILAARQLNYMAYTNRAMLANQVSLGQLVAFESWGRKYELAAQRNAFGYWQLMVQLAPIYAINTAAGSTVNRFLSAMFQYSAKLLNTANQNISRPFNRVLAPLMQHYVNGLQKIYSAHQKVSSVFTFGAQVEMIPGIIKDNAKDAELSNFGALATLLALTENNVIQKNKRFLKVNKDAGSKRRFAAFVNDSRDGWTRDRQRQFGLDFGRTTKIPLGLINITVRTDGFLGFGDIHGGTELRFLGDEDEYNWSSMDTLEGEANFGVNMKMEICLPEWLGGGCRSFSYGFPPIGPRNLNFAGASAEWNMKNGALLKRKLKQWKQAPYGKSWDRTPESATSAVMKGYNKSKRYFSGMPEFVDINEEKYPGIITAPTFIVSVRKNGDKLRTSDELDNLASGQLAVTTRLAGGREEHGQTTEGDPANILRNKINGIIDAYRDMVTEAVQTPGDLGEELIQQQVKKFEEAIKSKVDELQKIINSSLPNNAADKGGVFAIAAAEVYFKNPDEKAEAVKASTFSPYWQVRLKPVDPAILKWSAITQGLNIDAPDKNTLQESHFEDLSTMAQ